MCNITLNLKLLQGDHHEQMHSGFSTQESVQNQVCLAKRQLVCTCIFPAGIVDAPFKSCEPFCEAIMNFVQGTSLFCPLDMVYLMMLGLL